MENDESLARLAMIAWEQTTEKVKTKKILRFLRHFLYIFSALYWLYAKAE